MSFFNTNAIAIMLKPLLAKWIEPLEENGTLDKIAVDVQMIAASNAIPALGELVANMREHNALLREILERSKADGTAAGEVIPDTGSGVAGFVECDGSGMLEHNGTN